MKFDPQDQKDFLRIIKSLLVTALIIQVVTLATYYFGEKQSALAFPMMLGILVTAIAFGYTFGLRD